MTPTPTPTTTPAPAPARQRGARSTIAVWLALALTAGLTAVAACGGTGGAASASSTPPTSGTPGASASADAGGTAAGPYAVVTRTGAVIDATRARQLKYKAYAPAATATPTPVVLVSHGGSGSLRGHLSARHIGTTLARAGYLAVHIGHAPSSAGSYQVFDRPADVTFFLDRIAAGTLPLPLGYTGTPDLTQVGHLGHSFGAYTAHAVAGATFRYPSGDRTFRDARIDAIVALSPQGEGKFGAFIDGADSTWDTVTIPVLGMAGSLELDREVDGAYFGPGWRLQPFAHYPGASDTFMSVIAGMNHGDMWQDGPAAVKTWIAFQARQFFDAYLRGDTTVNACAIGVSYSAQVSVDADRNAGSNGSRIAACP